MTYGTKEYYADLFGDIIADVDPTNLEAKNNIVEGFKGAIDSWIEYHSTMVIELELMKKKANEEI